MRARVPGLYRRVLPLGIGSPASNTSQSLEQCDKEHVRDGVDWGQGGVRCARAGGGRGTPPTRPPPRLAVAPPMERRDGAEERAGRDWSMRVWVTCAGEDNGRGRSERWLDRDDGSLN